MGENDKPKPTTEQFEWLPTPGGPVEVYGNYFYVNWTPFELRLQVGQIIHDPRKQPGEVASVVVERCALSIPWQQVGALRGLLDACIAAQPKPSSEANPKTRGAN